MSKFGDALLKFGDEPKNLVMNKYNPIKKSMNVEYIFVFKLNISFQNEITPFICEFQKFASTVCVSVKN